MISRFVTAVLRVPWLVILLAVMVLAGGLVAYQNLDIEAYPNPVPPMVEVIAQPSGWSAEEVERYVTIPLEVGLSGMPGIDHIRSQSLFGLTDIKCYFSWDTAYPLARQEVINRIGATELPQGLQAQISPTNAIGEIFRYRVEGKGYDSRDLKTAQDWILERQFRQVPGVIDVVGFGGETKQYHVDVDPYRLKGENVTLAQVLSAIGNANLNVGGQRVSFGEQSYDVRGIGLLRGVHDIENVVVTQHNGVPVRVRDVADVNPGAAPRLGIVGKDDDDEIVQGIVLMRYGGETLPTLQGAHAKLDEIHHSHLLPPGMTATPYYDRGHLVSLTTHTVLENLLIGMALVAVILVLFLGNIRAALITALNIPLALLIAFAGMVLSGTPANLISLGAVDFGIVVDSTVIMTENVFKHLGSHGQGTLTERIRAAAQEVGSPMAFSTAIIAVAFLPLFAMNGVAGVIFSPMAKTYAFAVGGAIVLALSLTPSLLSLVIRTDVEERESLAMRTLRKVYRRPFAYCLRRPGVMTLVALGAIALGPALYPLLGGEFMPKLEEGNLYVRATMPSSISLEQAARHVHDMRSILRGCPLDPKQPCTASDRRHPEVETVVSQLGRPDDGTDVAGFSNIEIFAPLKPFEQWRAGLTKAGLTAELNRELTARFPGVVFNFSQMISDNVEEALSGVKGENSIKVIGPDLGTNESKAHEIEDALAPVRGVADLGVIPTLGQPSLRITVDRISSARYGLNSGDIDAVVQAAVGGQAATQVYEGEKRFDLVVRWLHPYRSSVASIRAITVPAPDGKYVPLGQLAAITTEEGPSVIYREDGHRYSPVKFSVRGRDLRSTVEDAKRTVSDRVHLPYEVRLEWAGQMNEFKQAMRRMSVILPLTLILIGVLVYAAVRSWLNTLIVFASLLLACTGGILALLVARLDFSVSAAMGFISVFGIAVQGAILIVTYFQRERAGGASIEEAAQLAADHRFRPVLMTTLVATLGLLPAAIANGIGAQAQKPLAVVVIGGSLFLALLTRIVQPPLLITAHRWGVRRGAAPSPRAPSVAE